MNQGIFQQLDDYFRNLIREELTRYIPQTTPAVEKQERPVTTKELCEHLGVTEPTVRRWRNKGVIPYFTIGSAVRFHLTDVIKSLEKRKSSKRVI
jgi:excisionase family DNA binding protein